MKEPFSRNQPVYKAGLITKGKRKLMMILSKLSYRLKFRYPKLPNLRKFSIPTKLGVRLGQTGVSILLFLLVLGVFQLQFSWAKNIQKEIRSTFSHEKDYSAQIKNYLTFGWWLNSYDRMVFTNRENEAYIPVVNSNMFSVPVNGKIVKKFGLVLSEVSGNEYFHEGIDIEAPLGTPIFAVSKGRVVRVTDDPILGRLLQINHGDGVYSLYAYCSEILVREGQEVAQNQVIAKTGQTGQAESPMLHFELREQGQLVDPLTRIQSKSSQI